MLQNALSLKRRRKKTKKRLPLTSQEGRGGREGVKGGRGVSPISWPLNRGAPSTASNPLSPSTPPRKHRKPLDNKRARARTKARSNGRVQLYRKVLVLRPWAWKSVVRVGGPISKQIGIFSVLFVWGCWKLLWFQITQIDALSWNVQQFKSFCLFICFRS